MLDLRSIGGYPVFWHWSANYHIDQVVWLVSLHGPLIISVIAFFASLLPLELLDPSPLLVPLARRVVISDIVPQVSTLDGIL